MASANLTEDGEIYYGGNDTIVIVRHLDSYRGGRTLDVTGYTPEIIKGGHIIIKETATGELKPMPVNAGNTAYAALPADHTYEGVNMHTVLTKRPFASILTNGTVNPVASPFPPPAEAITALINIQFRAD